MAHNIEIVNGVAKMAYAGETPWHGLGKEVPADLSTDQMLKAAELDWTVTKIPAYATIDDKKVSVGWSALTRSTDNKVLGIVSNEWHPVQNQEAFDFFSEYVEAGNMEMHTAGSLDGGRIVWALAKVKDYFAVMQNGRDQIDSYILFTNPHKFGQGIDIRFTPIRVVCNNTLTLALGEQAANVFKQSHRREFSAETAKETLGLAHSKMVKYKEMSQFLASKRYTEQKLKEYMRSVLPMITKKEEKTDMLSRSAAKALEIVEVQPGAEFAPGTWWNAFNAVTFLTDHMAGRSADTRLKSAWYGQNKNVKLKALKTAVEFAEAA
jgi:phage/plasmid-like protein (TIGR03299 family)